MNDNFYGTGQNQVGGAASGGQSAINAFDPNAWKQNTTSGFNSLMGDQNKTQNDYINAYKNQITSQPSATQYYQQGNNAFNVPALTQQANTLNNAVLSAPQTTLDSAKGFNFDNNQVQNQTNLTLGRLAPLAQSATNQAQTAQTLASQYANAGLAQNSMNLLPYQQQGQMLGEQFTRQATGFTTQAEDQLNGLVSKMQSGQQLSTAEMQAYSQLAGLEESYQQQLGVNQTGVTTANIDAMAKEQTQRLANQFAVIPAGQTFINTATGATYRPR